MAFGEIISFGISGSALRIVSCQFDASGELPYSIDTLTFWSVVALSLDGLSPTNNCAEAAVIVREDGGKELSQLEYTARSSTFDQKCPRTSLVMRSFRAASPKPNAPHAFHRTFSDQQ